MKPTIFIIASILFSFNLNAQIWESTTESINGENTEVINALDYNAHFLFGSPTVLLDNSTVAMRNDYNRIFYYDKQRSHFAAGRMNNLSGPKPQWDVENIAQYSATFGWDQFLYGGFNSINGAAAKGQFTSGYSNRGWGSYAQTLGFQNANGGVSSSIIGSENYIGKSLHDATYDVSTKEWTITGKNVTTEFPVGRFMGVRSFFNANGYYTNVTGKITSSTFIGGNTVIKGEHDEWGEDVTIGQLYNLEPSFDGKQSSIIGYNNVNQQSDRTYIIGTENEVNGKSNVIAIGNNLKPEISFAQVRGSETYTEKGDVQTYYMYPKVLKIGPDLFRLVVDDNNPFIDIPFNTSWYVSIQGIMKDTATNGSYASKGGLTLHRGYSGAAVIDDQSFTGNYPIQAYLFNGGSRLVFQFSSTDNIRGSFEVKINQVK